MQAEVTWEKEDKDIWECICEPKKKKIQMHKHPFFLSGHNKGSGFRDYEENASHDNEDLFGMMD